MDTKKIDIINIGLILVSLVIAFKLPFELFLFSYAVLGPLHYLTEINWLKERNYFVKSHKKWTILFTVFAVLLAIYPVYSFFKITINQSFDSIIKTIGDHTNALILIGFFFAVSLIFVKTLKHLISALLVSTLIAVLLTFYIPKSLILIGLFVPTLIHVYIFTLLFVIFGALKAKSKYGYYLAFILFCVPFVIWLIPIDPYSYKPTQDTLDTYVASNMMGVNYKIAEYLNGFQNGKFYAVSEIGLKIQVFIGFAYTYHYLNWFSKTSIIGWKKSISKQKGILILCIWILSVILYVYDYKTGLIALFFLSFLHVFLEFPLNALTIKEVFSLKHFKTK